MEGNSTTTGETETDSNHLPKKPAADEDIVMWCHEGKHYMAIPRIASHGIACRSIVTVTPATD